MKEEVIDDLILKTFNDMIEFPSLALAPPQVSTWDAPLSKIHCILINNHLWYHMKLLTKIKTV